MKIMIASDIHGSAKYCKDVLDAFERENCDRLCLLGDLLYHGPRNPLPEGYDPAETARLLSSYSAKITCVLGNCDSEVDQLVLSFPIFSHYAEIFADGHRIVLSHGHRDVPPLSEGDSYITGHTHVTVCERRDGVNYLNPGSVSLPKEGTVRGYIIYESDEFVCKTLDGKEYDRLKIL